MWSRAVCLWLVCGALASSMDRYSVRNPPDESRLLGSPSFLIDPSLFLLSHPPFQMDDNGVLGRGKRTGPSLSIVEPIDVLRSRVMMQMARHRMQKQNENQVIANRMLLQAVGKRQARDSQSETRNLYKALGEPDWYSS